MPVSAFAAPFSESQAAVGREQEAWLERRAGGTFVEKLQVNFLVSTFDLLILIFLAGLVATHVSS